MVTMSMMVVGDDLRGVAIDERNWQARRDSSMDSTEDDAVTVGKRRWS